ncbi:MAG: sulfur carrier protein ThiS [Lachnoclostridium sp.]|nr:sulfur carrier protein ThiS [Lachnoclostridium sp.]
MQRVCERMEIIMYVNGQLISITSEITLQEFLQKEGYDIQKIAVEKNGEIIPRKSFDAVTVSDNDKLEIVSFVGGG